MTEREKIAQIIAEHLCPQGRAHKTLYGAARRCYSRNNFADCEKVSDCVDALIEAGIGDVKERKFEADHYWRMWQGSLVELERAEHRTEVTERALLNLAYKIVIYIGTYTSDFSSIEAGKAKNYIELEIAAENVKNVELKQAEKELEGEEKK